MLRVTNTPQTTMVDGNNDLSVVHIYVLHGTEGILWLCDMPSSFVSHYFYRREREERDIQGFLTLLFRTSTHHFHACLLGQSKPYD